MRVSPGSANHNKIEWGYLMDRNWDLGIQVAQKWDSVWILQKNMQPHAFIEGFKIFNMGPIFNTGTLGHGKLIASINIFPKEI